MLTQKQYNKLIYDTFMNENSACFKKNNEKNEMSIFCNGCQFFLPAIGFKCDSVVYSN